MSMLLKLLMTHALAALAFLCPNAGPESDPPDPQEEDPPEDEIAEDAAPEGDDATEDATEDEPEEPAQRAPSRAAAEIQKLRERAQRVEAELAEMRASRQPSAPNPLQRQLEEEERQLADPNLDATTRWTIQANRTLRETQQRAAMTMAQAADDRDAAAYERKAASNPLFDKYRDRVEQLVADERKNGRTVGREQVLTYLIGQDMLAGNLKSTKASTKNQVPRGKPLTGVRSDVPRKGGMTEHQKRAARLQDQII